MAVRSIFKHVTDCFNSELKGKFQALISIDFFYFKKGKKFILKQLATKNEILASTFLFQTETRFPQRSNILLLEPKLAHFELAKQPFFGAVNAGLWGITEKTETKRQIFDIYSTIHCVNLFLKNQWSNRIFHFETKEFLERF